MLLYKHDQRSLVFLTDVIHTKPLVLCAEPCAAFVWQQQLNAVVETEPHCWGGALVWFEDALADPGLSSRGG